MNTFHTAISSLAASRKANVALTGVATVLLSRLLPRLGFSETDTNYLSTAIIGLFGVLIGSIAHEDAAAKAPQSQQVNVSGEGKATVTTAPAPVLTTPAPVAAGTFSATPIEPALTRADLAKAIADELDRRVKINNERRTAALAVTRKEAP